MDSSIFYRISAFVSFMAATLCGPINPALAGDTGMYFSVFGGGTYLENSTLQANGNDVGELTFDTGWNVGGAFGQDYGNLRAEIEAVYRLNQVDTADISPNVPPNPYLTPGKKKVDADATVLTYLVNVFWDFENKSPLTPYVGGGIGFATIDISDDVADEDNTVFAYKVATGIAWKLTPGLDLLVDYSFLATTDPEAYGEVDAEYATHNLSGGIRFRF